ncbi:MAG: hypothetical protein CBC16_04675 [Verrucomicrobia bacterium TMED56]|nr:MAG: hypothetical protein CBC16_04675 [Verrucomicrobia bacterium TMED56]
MGQSLNAISSFAFFIFLFVSLLIGIGCLTKGGDLLSDYCSSLAQGLGVPSVVVGLTVVSIATSAPELFTSISAIRSNATGLVIGNIIGSNIANIGLILGISLLIKPIDSKNSIHPIQLILLLGTTLFFSSAFFIGDEHSLGLLYGAILTLFIIIYLLGLSFHSLKNRVTFDHSKQDNEDNMVSGLKCLIMISIGGILLWLGSESLVYGSTNIARMAGLPDELIGFTLIALGTSLPELAASIALLRKNHKDMLLGNILGSNLFNLGLVGGISGILGPIFSNVKFPWIDHLSMLLLTLIFSYCMLGKKLNRTHGIFLLAAYLTATITTWIYNS